jgi:pentatricopeptide repeat protein
MQATIWVLEAYSKSLNGATQCHALLQDVKVYNTTLTDSGQAHIARQLFDAEVYSNAILAWSKAATEIIISENNDLAVAASTLSTENNDTIERAAKNAHTLLLELVDRYIHGSFANGSEPPLIAFNGVISAYSRLGHIDQAEDVLWLMERSVRPRCIHLVPNAISYNSILHGIYRQSQQQQQQQNNHDNMKHKNRNNNNNNNRQSNKNMALQKAMSIISYMEENSKEFQPAIQPNAFSYQTVMKCWLQSTNNDKVYIAEQAEMLLYKVEELWKQGDTSFEYTNRIYNMLLNAYAKTYSGKRFLSDKALDLLSRMKQSTHAQCQPDIISYTSTLDCIAQSSDPKAAVLADELLQEVKMRYKSTNDVQLRPNLRTYTMTIQSLARNNGNIIRARELLTELVQLYEQSGYDPQLKPNTYPYNYVLNCAANTIDKHQRLLAFQIATQTYQEMRQSKLIKPDSFSYAFWFKCCNNLLDPGPLRTKGIMYAFEECKRDGLVSNEVLTRLVQGSPKDVVNLLLQPPQLDHDTSSTITSNINTNYAPEYNDYNNRQIQQQRLRDRNHNGHNSPSSSSSSFRPMMTPTSTVKVNYKHMNNSQQEQYRTKTPSATNIIHYTIHDLPPSWSRNVRSTQI